MYTVKNFLDLLKFTSQQHSSSSSLSLICDDFDRTNSAVPLTKQTAARICHGVLLYWLKEPDDDDWAAARLLKDIYDCHTCVIHVAQVYVKGIIPAESVEPLVFGNKTEVTEENAKLIAERLFNFSYRLPPPVMPVSVLQYCSIKQLKNQKNIQIVVDVRPVEKTQDGMLVFPPRPEWILELADKVAVKNCPLKSLIQNPYELGQDFSAGILLFCSKGYQSSLAADILLKAGYLNVYVLKQ